MSASDTLSEATAPVKLPARHCPHPGHGCRLEIQYCKGGIPTATHIKLAFYAQRLPPILYIQYRIPVSSWSKAPWGLSVLAQVTSIFTGTSISPDALSRQCSNHYAFRAGRNLPDKEFRYLRTVIVTAAVYWGLNSKLRCLTSPLNLPSTGQASAHIPHLSVSHRPVFLLNSCLSLFSAALLSQGTPSPEVTGSFCRVP